ncbi:uncharacterized protein LOC129368144 isoform X1 [Poeciliopsis prolifica]|uniref:uncharacterized protein LOC129368144 isoform X1 n=2 Tax=Poeciliopsis prolifica TaxID=188132 RepID=UPI0024132402|nr:uncharacterized protein LOC129368144 isoform X1 [Poeciliopsis prolifica]
MTHYRGQKHQNHSTSPTHEKACKVKVAQDMPRGLGSMASRQVQPGSYETPTASELHRLMWTKKGGNNRMDEVYPRIYIGDMYAAKDKRTLQAHHITHVLNAADGKFNVNTGPSFYRDTAITYHGVEAFDMPSFDLSPFFYPAASFIKNALSLPTGEEALLALKVFLFIIHMLTLGRRSRLLKHLSVNSHYSNPQLCYSLKCKSNTKHNIKLISSPTVIFSWAQTFVGEISFKWIALVICKLDFYWTWKLHNYVCGLRLHGLLCKVKSVSDMTVIR